MWLLSIFLSFLLCIYFSYYRSQLFKIPGVPSLPILGSFPYLFYYKGHQSLKWYEEQSQNYGPLSRVVGLFEIKNSLLVREPEDVKYFLMENAKNYERRPPVKRFDELFGDGIFNSRGSLWKRQRKEARPFFRKIGDHITTIESYFFSQEDLLNANVDVQDFFYQLTLRIICKIGFGVDVDLNQVLSFNDDFNRAQAIVERNIRDPINEYLPNKEWNELLPRLNKFSQFVVNSGNGSLLHFEKEDSPEYKRQVVLNFIIAGRDTTATLLTWTLFCLALHPSVIKRLEDEIQKIEFPLTKQKIWECEYLFCVFNEVLRLYPPIPVDVRCAIKDDVIRGKKIPSGTFVVYSAWVLGKSSKWKEPRKFWPERWLGNEPRRYPSPKFGYLFVPFHAGPQTCLGKDLAYLEASIILIHIIRGYRFNVSSEVTVTPRKNITLYAKNGLWMKFTPRNTQENDISN